MFFIPTNFVVSPINTIIGFVGLILKNKKELFFMKTVENIKSSAKKVLATSLCAISILSAGLIVPSVAPNMVSTPFAVTANAAIANGVYCVGSRGTQVQYIQWNLNALGFNCGTPDGIFGNMTKNAVMSFQRAYGLTVDGIVGSQTINKLNSLGQTVQNKLRKLGYNVSVDGILGPQSTNAIRDFQRRNGLSVNGIVTSGSTWSKMTAQANQKTSVKKLNKSAVLNYANTYCNRRNYNYNYYNDNNCCNFVSQCLVAGGLPTNSTFRNGTSAFIYIPSFISYMQNNHNVKYISRPSASQIEVGDVILTSSSHVMIVTRKSGNTIYANGNTNNRYQLQVSYFYAVLKTSALMN